MSQTANRPKELAEDLLGAERRNTGAAVEVSHLPPAGDEALFEVEP